VLGRRGQAAIRDWFRARHDRIGNLPLFPGVFPDQFAPIVRGGADGERELVMARWGMPAPPQFDGLTTEANAVVAPVHPKAMPVILTSPAEVDRWLEADTPDALSLQRPLPDDALRIVARGEKEDAPPQG
jgi:putative SOS response-associated peptidase YedK